MSTPSSRGIMNNYILRKMRSFIQLKPNPKQFAGTPGLCIAAAWGVRKISIQDFRYMTQTAPTQQAHSAAKPSQGRFPAVFTVG